MNKLSAVFIGVLISIMITFNGALSIKVGNYPAVVIIHIAGIIVVSTILIVKRQKITFKERLPLYLFSAGAIGVIMTIFNNLCVNTLGVSLTLSIGLFGQSVASTIIDHFGLLGMETHKLRPKKIIGFFIVLCGVIIMTIY